MSGHSDGDNPAGAAPRANMPYKAYLIRCWQEGHVLRYSLEGVGSSERRGFDRVTDLLAALENELQGGQSNEP